MQDSRRHVIKAFGAALAASSVPRAFAQAKPIKIGFGMALTGGIAINGKAALLSMQMWQKEVNAKGGLLGRPVEFVYYDDQSNPSTVPGIYTKLLDVDKVDVIVSGYATNMQAPAMPVVMQRGMMFVGLFGLAVNDQFKYDRFFQMMPSGPNARLDFSKGFLDTAMSMNPKPTTIALLGADAEYPHIALDGARENVKKLGLKVVYDKTYPPTTIDAGPIMRAVAATNPDVVFVASYPPDSVAMVRAATEVGLKTKMFGGGMIGLQSGAVKAQLGAQLNNIVYYDLNVPEPTMNFPGIKDFLGKYQAQAQAAGVDLLGFYLPPFAYSAMQIYEQTINAVKSTDNAKMAEYAHKNTFKTIVGDIKFGGNGEWAESRLLFVQYQGIVGNDINQFKEVGKQVILTPAQYKSGNFKYPYKG
ncbi:MAG: branched-chain amino acid transporter substrate-binding protein [Betaproteobacteria bacterium]|nr:branched-chain amino acid transporter substrate-binding protein [Betaproteobacteria bacterium]